MGNEPRKHITINDLTGLGPYLERHHITIALKKEDNGRVVGVVEATPEVYQLMGEFQSNPEVRLLDFLGDQRRLRGRMLDMRDGDERVRRNGYVGRKVS